MVGRSSEVSLSEYDDIRMKNVKYNNGEYCVAVQGIEPTKPVLFKRYVFIPRGNTYYMTGTGQCRTHVC